MDAIFGAGQVARLFLPKGSADWRIGKMIQRSSYDNVLLLSFSLQDKELIDVRRCFDETTHVFAFGRNPIQNVMQVSLLMFIYNGCDKSNGPWATLDDIRKMYSKYRVYKSNEPLSITMDDFTSSGFLIDMSIGEVNPINKTSVITLTFLLDQEV